jgi:hypothetical protein
MSRRKNWGVGTAKLKLIAGLVFFSLLSGCVSADKENHEKMEINHIVTSIIYGVDPILINQTVESGYFWFEAPMVDDCVLSPNIFTYVMFDRYGNKEEHIVYMDDTSGLQKIRIDVLGDLPNIFAGSYPRCADTFQMRLHGVTDAIRIFRHGYNLDLGWMEWVVEVEVPPGSSRAEVVIDTPYYAYDLRQAVPWQRDPVWRWGTISLESIEYDFFVRKSTYSTPIGAGNVHLWNGYHHPPGGLKVVLELDPPVPVPVQWEYIVQYHVLNEQVCIFDLEWDICR